MNIYFFSILKNIRHKHPKKKTLLYFLIFKKHIRISKKGKETHGNQAMFMRSKESCVNQVSHRNETPITSSTFVPNNSETDTKRGLKSN